MKLPVQITFRNIPSSTVAEEWIREEVDKLETFYERPVGCRVAVEVPHRHHRKGSPYHVRVEIALPGGEIVVNRAPNLGKYLRETGELAVRKHLELDPEHKNLRLAINEAFRAAGRRLSDYARRRRGEVKTHRARARRLRRREAGGEDRRSARSAGTVTGEREQRTGELR